MSNTHARPQTLHTIIRRTCQSRDPVRQVNNSYVAVVFWRLLVKNGVHTRTHMRNVRRGHVNTHTYIHVEQSRLKKMLLSCTRECIRWLGLFSCFQSYAAKGMRWGAVRMDGAPKGWGGTKVRIVWPPTMTTTTKTIKYDEPLLRLHRTNTYISYEWYSRAKSCESIYVYDYQKEDTRHIVPPLWKVTNKKTTLTIYVRIYCSLYERGRREEYNFSGYPAAHERESRV